MKPRPDCPGCGGRTLAKGLEMKGQPTVLNYRFRTVAQARKVPRGDIALRQCGSCGLVFNATFDGSLIPYDERYENRQGASPSFRAHVDALIQRLGEVPGVRGGRLLEVGCGKGEFLRRAAEQLGATGEGHDTSYEGPAAVDGGRVRFHRGYLTGADVQGTHDVVICRHVVEHVAGIGAFLGELASIARAAGDPLVVVETPRFEWIVAHGCLWDVFYEHCNYFTQPTLAHLARRAGLVAQRHVGVFGGQYQWLELRVARRASGPTPRPGPGVPSGGSLAQFTRSAAQQRRRLARAIDAGRGDGTWGIWGAGAKGVALTHLMEARPPACVVDANPAKQGGVIPGTSVPVVAPTHRAIARLGLMVIANPNYAAEIRASLEATGFHGNILCL
jgi:SAM-dependent methyltransferase